MSKALSTQKITEKREATPALQYKPNGRSQALEPTRRQRRHGGDELQELPAFGFSEARKHIYKVEKRGGFAIVSIRGNQTRQQLFFRPRVNLHRVSRWFGSDESRVAAAHFHAAESLEQPQGAEN